MQIHNLSFQGFFGFSIAKYSPDDARSARKILKNNPADVRGTMQQNFHNCSTEVGTDTKIKKFSIFKSEK